MSVAVSRPGEMTFTRIGASELYRYDGEWPEYALASMAYLGSLKAPLIRWRDVDLIEFACTNGRCIYRLVKYDGKRMGWVLRREYVETYG